MKNYLILFIAAFTIPSCMPHKIKYPVTRKADQEDNYFGTQVKDPYRWLEDDQSEETKNWVKAENDLTFSYLGKIPFRQAVKARIEDLWNYEKYGTPFKKAGKYYFFKNNGLQNQSVLYVQDSLAGEPRVFIDPNQFSADGTISLGDVSFTKDGTLCGYSVSESGSDWQKIIVRETSTGKILGDTLKNVKFSGIAWYRNEGFYYSSYDKPAEGSQLSGITMHHKLLYHRLGTPQSADVLVLGGEAIPRRYIGASISEDQRYLMISAAESTSGNELYAKDLSSKNSPIIPLIKGFENNYFFIDHAGSRLLVLTNDHAPNYRVVSIDPSSPLPGRWREIVKETEEVLSNVTTAGNHMFLTYLKDASSRVFQYSMEGKPEREIRLPSIGTTDGFSGEKEDTSVFFQFTSFTYPAIIYHYHLASGNYEMYKSPALKFKPEDFDTRQVFYNSKDGTRVPMFIVMKKGTPMNSRNPLLLYGYGGFNISLTPAFSVRWLYWLDMGGIFAMPNIRGGGEYGEKWHEAGMKMKKQNVFDDFAAAAQYLQSNGYTSPGYTTLFGGSNGGLLVGAVMTQHPEICKVALPAVGVMDMLRYHRFTAGAGWISDYGCADSSKAMFEYLYSYSPVHNVRNVSYPATLVTTSDHDDRVVPAHSFKFAAELQANQQGYLPVMMRIETKAGHGGGKPTSKVIDEVADCWSFAWYNMKLKPVYAE